MAGSIITRNVLITGSSGQAAHRDGFAEIARFFDNHGGYSRIASSGSFGATGETSASIEQSFGVWRAVSASLPFDVILKWSYNDIWNFWDSAANSFGIGMLVGIHASGEAWAGTTTNTNDTKPASPFVGNSIVYSRRSQAGGTLLATGSKNGFLPINGSVMDQNTRIVMSGDNDSFTLAFDSLNNNSFNSLTHWGPYIPSNSEYTLPRIFFCYSTPTFFTKNTVYGGRSKAASEACLTYMWLTGSVSTSLPAVEAFKTDYYTYQSPVPVTSSFLPDMQEYPILLTANETGGEYVGYLDTIRVTYSSLANGSQLNSGSRLVISQSTAASNPTITIPWNNTAFPSGTFYSGSCVFMTGSNAFGTFGGTGIAVDRLGTTDAIITVVTTSAATVLYRGFLGGNYVYSEGSPPGGGAINIVKLRS